MKRAGQYWVPDHETLQIDALSKGPWQLDHLTAALSYVPPDRRAHAIDGGAHVGSWTIALAERFDMISAFEPADDTFECLAENLKDWRAEHPRRATKFNVYHMALGEKWGKSGMADDGKYAGGNTGGRYLKGDGKVLVQPIDVFRFEALDFLKLDLEGYELFALRGARNTIETFRPVVMIEDKHRMAFRYNLEPGAAGEFLESLGMREAGHVGADRIFTWP